MTKNALVYCVDGNKRYVDCMVNSILSFCATNTKELIESTSIFVITRKKNLNVEGIPSGISIQYISELSCDYSKISFKEEKYRKRFGKAAYHRWEIFKNPVFNDYDNILYLDCDTEICGPLDGIFCERDKPAIGIVKESVNMLKDVVKEYWNSGVMLFTPRLFGKKTINEFCAALMKNAIEFKDTYVDQDALNRTLVDKRFSKLVLDLGSEYNFFISTQDFIADRKCKIIHYAGTNSMFHRRYRPT